MYHSTEFVADLRELPVPTTSPTYANGKPCSLSPAIWPATSSWSMPSLGFLSMANACKGMSGRDQASGAGDKSSVFVSPVTLKTVTVIFSCKGSLLVNHSALAQDSMTSLAFALPAWASCSTSWKASKTKVVVLKASAAICASSPSKLQAFD